MSTKTTFKRIALVTVAALGFGLLTSVAPSSAVAQSDTLTIATATTTYASGSALSQVTNTLTQTFLGVNSDTMSVSARRTSAPSGSSAMVTVGSGATPTSANISVPILSSDRLSAYMTDTNSAVSTYNVASAAYNIQFTPDYYGTYVFTFTPYVQVGGSSAQTDAGRSTTIIPIASAVTWTIVVSAAASPDSTSLSVTVAGSSTGCSASSGSADASANTLRFAASGSSVAVICITPRANDVLVTGSTSTTAVVSGPGSVTGTLAAASVGASAGTRTLTLSSTAGEVYHKYYVFGDGTTGTTTVTITLGALTFTETIYFYGALSTITTTTANSVIDSGSGSSSATILYATAKDANGNVRPGTVLYAVSGTTTVFSAGSSFTTGSSGIATIVVHGLIAGTSAVTVQNVATGSTATISATAVSIRTGDDLASSVEMTLDKATYTPGEAMLLTLTIKDAAGNLVAPGTHEVLSTTLVASRALSTSNTMPGAAIITTGSTGLLSGSTTVSRAGYGVVTYSLNAPNTAGAFTLSATAGADNASAGSTLSISTSVGKTANELANDAAIAAATAAGVAATAAAEAATDAATEAIDAANAATEAANAAAEAADAATAAAIEAGEMAVAAAEAAEAAAVDAAAEATDAANAATDAANAATESADAATAAAQDAVDAVAALSTQVATLISGLKAQLTALTNLVIKIQKKVKA